MTHMVWKNAEEEGNVLKISFKHTWVFKLSMDKGRMGKRRRFKILSSLWLSTRTVAGFDMGWGFVCPHCKFIDGPREVSLRVVQQGCERWYRSPVLPHKTWSKTVEISTAQATFQWVIYFFGSIRSFLKKSKAVGIFELVEFRSKSETSVRITYRSGLHFGTECTRTGWHTHHEESSQRIVRSCHKWIDQSLPDMHICVERGAEWQPVTIPFP